MVRTDAGTTNPTLLDRLRPIGADQVLGFWGRKKLGSWAKIGGRCGDPLRARRASECMDFSDVDSPIRFRPR
jgi:hypothetical protein